jgi:hypothetical protein
MTDANGLAANVSSLVHIGKDPLDDYPTAPLNVNVMPRTVFPLAF